MYREFFTLLFQVFIAKATTWYFDVSSTDKTTQLNEGIMMYLRRPLFLYFSQIRNYKYDLLWTKDIRNYLFQYFDLQHVIHSVGKSQTFNNSVCENVFTKGMGSFHVDFPLCFNIRVTTRLSLNVTLDKFQLLYG